MPDTGQIELGVGPSSGEGSTVLAAVKDAARRSAVAYGHP